MKKYQRAVSTLFIIIPRDRVHGWDHSSRNNMDMVISQIKDHRYSPSENRVSSSRELHKVCNSPNIPTGVSHLQTEVPF